MLNIFWDCYGLTSVTIPNSVTSIGDYAFYCCSHLKKVIVKDIAAWCGIKFNYSDSNPLYYAKHIYSDEDTEITNLIIPNSVTSIGEWAFAYCYGLTSVTIPNSVTSIGNRAFVGCSGLTSVTIGSGVTSIGYSAFDGVDIPTVISLIENPFKITGKTSDSRTFSQNTFNNATLYVPVGTIDKYKATEGWKDFLFIEENPNPSDYGDIVIHEMNFPDENFRAYLMRQSYGMDGVITEGEIKNVVRIDVSQKNITTLKGIEYFTALMRLYCYGNQLTSLDVSKNTALTDLSCSDNQLTSLDVSKNTALTDLSCSDNQLTSLDVSKNTALTRLVCYRNQLTSLDVSKNTALTFLSCDDNQLTSLDVSKNTALEKLSCAKIHLTSLDLSKNTSLTSLSCSNNQLTKLNVSKNTALTYLDCVGNKLTILDVSKNTALAYLYCHKNQLTSLDVSKNTALKELFCYDNKIKGEAMDALVESLPNQSSAEMRIIDLSSSSEKNVCTTIQVNTAKEKGWRVLTSSGNDYEGSSDPSGIHGITLDDNVNTSIYDLNGRRLKKPGKGISIINGKKYVKK